MRVLVIDNHDSYTWNLVHQIAGLTGQMPIVARNDAVDLDDIRRLDPAAVVLSPGPGRPEVASDLGVCASILRELDRPLLGVCLGHQGLGWVHGARIVRAPRQLHGRRSRVRHDGEGLFEGLPQGFWVVRYHSLAVTGPIPAPLEATAWSDDGVIMALRDTSARRYGVQFHPESICTEHGAALMGNFLRLGRPVQVAMPGPVTPSVAKPSRWRAEFRVLEHTIDAEGAFAQLFAGRHGAFWLDSSGKGGANPARFSYLGAADGPHGELLTWRVGARVSRRRARQAPEDCGEDLMAELRQRIADMATDAEVPFDFIGGWVGWLGYEARAQFSQPTGHSSPTPDAAFAFCDRLVVIDHQEGRTWLVALVPEEAPDEAHTWFSSTSAALGQLSELEPPSPRRQGVFVPDKDRATYASAVRIAQRHIARGESYEICLTHQVRGAPVQEPFQTYRVLRRANPAPYSAYLSFDDVQVLCSSPERFLTVDRSATVSTRPIKGTAARHADPAADALAAAALSQSPKDLAENLMIVDLMRNDLGRVCRPGSVRVPSLMAVESFATVHHLVSTVTGELSDDNDALDAIAAAFPPGSMTGAPKLRTMQIIDELEGAARGIYSGTIGYISVNGACDLNVVIRTAVCTTAETTVGAGGAVVSLSNPDQEWQEAQLKAGALLAALEDSGVEPQSHDVDEWIR